MILSVSSFEGGITPQTTQKPFLSSFRNQSYLLKEDWFSPPLPRWRTVGTALLSQFTFTMASAVLVLAFGVGVATDHCPVN